MKLLPVRLVGCALCLALGACSFGGPHGASDPAPDGPALPSDHDWTTFNWNVERSGASSDPTGITPANVASMQRQQVRIDGTVDASAIYLHGAYVNGRTHNAIFVTTSYGKTIAIDADTGAVLWTFTPPDYSSFAGTRRVTTSTPAADPGRKFIYAASPDGHVQKLSVQDGHVSWSTAITLLPEREKIASPLTFIDGKVIAVTGGYIGDAPPYQGHVAILNADNGHLEHVWNSLCSDRSGLIDPKSCANSDSAIWGRAGAVVDPASKHIFVATGNGKWDGKTNWGDALVELDGDATRMLGNYTPSNTSELDEEDADLGSTSPVLLGGGYLAQGGKDQLIRILRLDQIAGTEPHRGGELQTVPTPSGRDLFTAPAVWHNGGETWLFAADGGATQAWTFADGRLTDKWKNDTAGTSPVVAGGLLFVYSPRGGLNVYDPTSGRKVATLECGSGHWNSPIVVDGRIILPEGSSNSRDTSGVVDIWRLPAR